MIKFIFHLCLVQAQQYVQKNTTIWTKSTKIKSVQNLLWPSCIQMIS